MMSINLSDIAILNIKSDDYCCIIDKIIKSDVTDVMENTKKSAISKKAKHCKA